MMETQNSPDTTFSSVLASLAPRGDAFRADPPEAWRQGRTLFGGLAASLALQSALKKFAELPTLRSAQLAFVGPASGILDFSPVLLRRGKSTAFVGVEGLADGEPALVATFVFGASRLSQHVYRGAPMPDVAMPGDALPSFFDSPLAPRFTGQFEAFRVGDVRPFSGAATPKLELWLRHRDAAAPDDIRSLVALADVPPPAALAMFVAGHAISTVTWSFDVLCERFGGSGWHFMQIEAETVGEGYSSQRMMLWDTAGAAVLAARQTIAIFG